MFPLKPIKEIWICLVHQAHPTLNNIKMPIFTLPYFKNLQKKSMSNSCHWMHTMYVHVVHFLTPETAHFENMWEKLRE